MSVTEYPPQSFESMSRKQAITTCYALEDQRDRALEKLKNAMAEIHWLVEDRAKADALVREYFGQSA